MWAFIGHNTECCLWDIDIFSDSYFGWVFSTSKYIYPDLCFYLHLLDTCMYTLGKSWREIEIKKRAPRLGLFKVSRQRPTFTHSKNALSSALQALTSEVGMGSGVAPVLKSSKNQISYQWQYGKKLSIRIALRIRIRIILIKPHGKLVSLGWTCYHAYTCDLSNS